MRCGWRSTRGASPGCRVRKYECGLGNDRIAAARAVSVSYHPVLVVGAGVVGLSVALYLQRAGMQVAVLDPLGPAGGASFGNAGMLSPDTATPIAMPGMLRKVPGWLRDPLGPLAVRPSYFPRALPWLLQWVKAGRLERVLAISDAMRALHRDTLTCWRELLGDTLYRDLIRPSGQVHVWEGDDASPTEAIEQQIRDRHGIAAQTLNADDLRQMFPGLARDITRGLFVPGNGHTVSPQRIVHSLAELFRAAGGAIVAERAMKLIPREGGSFTVMTNTANRIAERVVVAAGAWSAQLLAPLGIRVPLETERGYHAMLFSPSVTPRHLSLSPDARHFCTTFLADSACSRFSLKTLCGLAACEPLENILDGHSGNRAAPPWSATQACPRHAVLDQRSRRRAAHQRSRSGAGNDH